MMNNQAPRTAQNPTQKILIIVGVIMLGLVTLALVFLAMNQTNNTTPNVDDYEPPVVVDEDSTETTENDETTTNAEEDKDGAAETNIEVSPVSVVLAIGPNNQVVIGEKGSCLSDLGVNGFGTASSSADGGSSWSPLPIQESDVAEIIRVGVYQDGYTEMVALDEFCEPMFLRSFTAGVSWQPHPETVSTTWFYNPHTPDIINTPLGEVTAPCEVAQLGVSYTEETAAVLCADSSVQISNMAESVTWQKIFDTTNAVSLNASDEEIVLATPGTGECQGVQLKKLTIGQDEVIDFGACIDFDAVAGKTAVSVHEDSVAVVGGDEYVFSLDRGDAWL